MSEPRRTQIDISTRTFVRFWAVILGLVGILGAIYFTRTALIIIIISLLIALVLNRPVSFLTKKMGGTHRAHFGAAVLVLIAVFLVVVLAAWAIIPMFVQQIAGVIAALPDTLGSSTSWIYDFAVSHHWEDQYAAVVETLKTQASSWGMGLASNVFGVVGGLVNAIVVAFFIIMMVYFMLMEGGTWMERLWRLGYQNKARREHHQTLALKMYDTVSGYVNGTALIGLISSLLAGAGLLVLSLVSPEIPLSVVLPSMLVLFVCAFIPMFGATIGGVIVSLLLLLFSWPAAIIFVIYFVVYQQIENNLFAPKIFAKHLKISPLTVLVALAIGTYSGGILGIFIAIPLAGCAQIIVREIFVDRKLHHKFQ
jgi:predicted PurR-regulated permease PerM